MSTEEDVASALDKAAASIAPYYYRCDENGVLIP